MAEAGGTHFVFLEQAALVDGDFDGEFAELVDLEAAGPAATHGDLQKAPDGPIEPVERSALAAVEADRRVRALLPDEELRPK